MAQRTRAQIKSDAASSIPNNVSGEINPGGVRERVVDLADSAALFGEPQQWTKPQRSSSTTLSVVAGSIAWDLAAGNDFTVTLTANATLSLPTGIATHVGQKGRILVSQDGTGGRTLAVNANIIPLGTSSVPDMPSAANAKAYLAYDVISTTEVVFTLTGVGE